MITESINISPVNMEDRKKLGVKAGDTVRVWVKIQEKGKTRLQAFEGIVLATKHGAEAGATFTVRKVSQGVGIERIFPLYSPIIDKIEIVKRANVRRAKLYHIREKVAREVKRQMRKMKMVDLATMSETEEEGRKAKEEVEKTKAAEEAEASKDETLVETPTEEVKEEATEEAKDETPVEEVTEKKEEVVEEVKEEEKKES